MRQRSAPLLGDPGPASLIYLSSGETEACGGGLAASGGCRPHLPAAALAAGPGPTMTLPRQFLSSKGAPSSGARPGARLDAPIGFRDFEIRQLRGGEGGITGNRRFAILTGALP